MRQEPFIPIYDLTDSPPDDEPAAPVVTKPISNEDFIKMLDAVLGAPIYPIVPIPEFQKRKPFIFPTYTTMKRGDKK